MTRCLTEATEGGFKLILAPGLRKGRVHYGGGGHAGESVRLLLSLCAAAAGFLLPYLLLRGPSPQDSAAHKQNALSPHLNTLSYS